MAKISDWLSDFDKMCLDTAIMEAERSFADGNYPVGAVLAVGDHITRGNNTGETTQNYSNHAETSLVMTNGKALLRAATQGITVTLYSTLEPCLMCLGAAVMNKVSRIMYVQADPHAGACSISRDSLGLRYQETWPEIVHIPYSSKPKALIVSFLRGQIAKGVRVEWSQRFLKLLDT